MTELDMKFLHTVVENHPVAVGRSKEMTHSGNFLRAPGTGKRVVATGMWIREVKSGEVTAGWGSTILLGLMKQLGVIPLGS